MNREGDQIESGEDRREVVFSVAEIVLEIVPLGFQGVESFVLDFPPRPSGGGEVLDVVGVDWQIGDEAVAISADLLISAASGRGRGSSKLRSGSNSCAKDGVWRRWMGDGMGGFGNDPGAGEAG